MKNFMMTFLALFLMVIVSPINFVEAESLEMDFPAITMPEFQEADTPVFTIKPADPEPEVVEHQNPEEPVPSPIVKIQETEITVLEKDETPVTIKPADPEPEVVEDTIPAITMPEFKSETPVFTIKPADPEPEVENTIPAITMAEFNVGFNDVSANAWYYGYVCQVARKGIMIGVNNTDFAPGMSVTRGMYMVVLYRIVANDTTVKKQHPFIDVGEKDYYYDAIIWGYQSGIIKGTGEDKFLPDKMISRQDAALILMRLFEAIKKGENATDDEMGIKDLKKVDDYALKAVKWAFKNSLFVGDSQGNFNPKQNFTRAECATVVCRGLASFN